MLVHVGLTRRIELTHRVGLTRQIGLIINTLHEIQEKNDLFTLSLIKA
jgi:hypothetical protein